MAIDKTILRKEIERQVEKYQNYIKEVQALPNMEEIRQIIIKDEELMKLYAREDIDEIMEEYISIIEEAREQYTSPENTNKKNILNTLEYIRFMSTYENIEESKIIQTIVNLSQSSISSVFLGKGVCASQARQMRDILPMESRVECVNFYSEEEDLEDLIIESHDVVIGIVDGEEKYLDPTWYNGTAKSLKGSNGKVEHGKQSYKSFEATQEEIDESKMEVAMKLIEELGIDEISKELQLEGMDDIKKQCAIFTYIERGIDTKDCELTHLTTKINGRNIEVGKAIELFFIDNDIQYSLLPSTGDKLNSMLKVSVNGKETVLTPKEMYNLSTGRLTQKLHSKVQNNEIVPIWAGNPNMKEEYRTAIREGREKVETIEKGRFKEIFKEDIKNAQITIQELLNLSKSIEKDTIENDKSITK